jgi:CelD/BcsL family acetyltransferase involved in cellulose biosynthesis
MARMTAEDELRGAVELWTGETARARLNDPAFRAEWERLYGACPWATVFQSPAYASTWYEFYPGFVPVVVGASGADGRLRGLLLLAVAPHGGLVAAGARQAEYQVWLARPEDGDAFIQAALERLASAYPRETLTLRYLPPDTPRAWLRRRRGVAARCVLRAARRGIVDVARLASHASGKKERYRLRQLERAGPVVYELVSDPARVGALLEEMAPLCDLRQGAFYDVLPFRGDPAKLPFHRALAREPGLLYVSVLRCGDQIAAADVDADNRGQLTSWLSALWPRFSRHSPGRVAMLFKVQRLAQDGWSSVDLTPGDPYKDAMATRFDETYTLRVFFSRRSLAAWRAGETARRALKAMVVSTGIEPSRLRERASAVRAAIEAVGTGSAPVRAVRALGARLWAYRQTDLYEFRLGAVTELPAGDPLRVDHYADLVGYRGGLTGLEPRRAFLRRAWSRLERGSSVYTRVDGRDLTVAAWVSAPPAAPEDAALAQMLPTQSALVHDLIAAPAHCRPDEWVAVLPQLVRDAAGRPGVARVLLAVPQGRDDLAEAARRLGGVHVGALHEKARAGRARRWSTVDAARAVAPAPAEAAEARG